MDWLVPVVFIVASLAQWWLKRRPTVAPDSERPRELSDPLDEFGDLMEALGRRRHESPPPSPKPQAIPPRILPPTPSPQPMAATGLTPPRTNPQEPSLANRPLGLRTAARDASHGPDWRRAFVLSEILAPAVALR